MPSQALTNLGLNFNWNLGEDGWKTGFDINQILLDWLAQPYTNVAFKSVSAQPGSPSDGDAYVLGVSPTGADWATQMGAIENDLIIYNAAAPDVGTTGSKQASNGWIKVTPLDGWIIYDRTTDSWYQYNGTVWSTPGKIPVQVLTASSTNLGLIHGQALMLCTLAGDQTVVIQDDVDFNHPVGTTMTFYKSGTGTFTVAEDAANTIRLPSGHTGDYVTTQYGTVEVYKEAADSWVLISKSVPHNHRALGDQGGPFEPIMGDQILVLTAAYDSADNFNIPDNATVPFPVDWILTVFNYSGGAVTITDDAAVTYVTDTLNPTGSLANNNVLRIQKLDPDEWITLQRSVIT